MPRPRQDFSLEFFDLGDHGQTLRRGIRAVVLGRAAVIVFIPDLDGVWPPEEVHASTHLEAARDALAKAHYAVVVDDARAGMTAIGRDLDPSGTPRTWTRPPPPTGNPYGGEIGEPPRTPPAPQVSRHERVVFFVTRSEFRAFATDLTAALMRGGRDARPWHEWAQLAVVRFIRHDLMRRPEFARDLRAIVDLDEGPARPELVCPRCGGNHVVPAYACRTCGHVELEDRSDHDGWFARWNCVPRARTDDARTRALWAAVLAAPADDAPRLVLADHLLAQGDPRGELIAVQCALAQTPADATLLAREKELLSMTAPARRDLLARASQYAIDRGFLDDLTFEGPRFDLDALRFVLAHPEIRTVRALRFVKTHLAESGAHLIADALAADDGPLASISALVLRYAMIGDAGADRLATARPLAHLIVEYDALGDAAARAIADRAAPTLRQLALAYNRIGPDGAVALARARRLAALDGLWLANNPLGADGAAQLVLNLALPALAHLDLSRCGLSDGSVLASTTLARIQHLTLTGNAIGDRGLEALLHAPPANLTALSLGGAGITDDGIALLCKRGLPSLRSLALEDNPITDRAIDLLERSPLWSQLASLYVYGRTRVTAERLDAVRARNRALGR